MFWDIICPAFDRCVSFTSLLILIINADSQGYRRGAWFPHLWHCANASRRQPIEKASSPEMQDWSMGGRCHCHHRRYRYCSHAINLTYHRGCHRYPCCCYHAAHDDDAADDDDCCYRCCHHSNLIVTEVVVVERIVVDLCLYCCSYCASYLVCPNRTRPMSPGAVCQIHHCCKNVQKKN